MDLSGDNVISLRLKKNKQVFLRPLFLKQMRQAGFYFLFLKKQMRPLFLFFI